MDKTKRPQPSRPTGPKAKRSRNDVDDMDPSAFEEELALLEQVEAELSQDSEWTQPSGMLWNCKKR